MIKDAASAVGEEIDSLGRQVEQCWQAAARDRGAFPGIAARCLAERRLHERLSPEALADWALSLETLPRQLSLASNFGDPPLTVYWGPDFLIDAYFWLEPKTDTHDHAFSGAFTGLRGLTLHNTFDFDVRERHGEDILLGRRKARLTEILRPGDIREIHSGPAFIHRVWHLTRPSLSLVIRTRNDLPIQYGYLEQHAAVRFVERADDGTAVRRRQLLRHMHGIDHPGFEDYARRLVAESKPLAAFELLTSYCRMVEDAGRIASLYEAAQRRHGPAFGALHEAFVAAQPLNNVKWRSLRAEGPRLLLGLLFSLEERADIERLIAQAYPGCRPQEKIVEWLKDIFERDALHFKLPEASLAVVESMLAGGTADDALAALRRSFDLGEEGAAREKMARLFAGLREHPLLKPLFRTEARA